MATHLKELEKSFHLHYYNGFFIQKKLQTLCLPRLFLALDAEASLSHMLAAPSSDTTADEKSKGRVVSEQFKLDLPQSVLCFVVGVKQVNETEDQRGNYG